MTILELAPARIGIDRPRGEHVLPARGPERPPLRHRLLRPGRDTQIMLGLALVATIVRSIGLFGFPSLADDEGTYVAQAQAVRWGELAHYTYWYDHPPLGWIQLAALDWIPQHLLPGVEPVAASRLIAVLAATITTVLIYPMARRMGSSRLTAGLGGLLAALSPLAVTLQRQVYLDTFATAWAMAAFLLAYDRRQRLWAHVAAGICFAVAVLTKETTAVLLPALLWAVLQNSGRRTRLFSVVGLLGSFVLVVAYYPLMALLRGELFAGPGHVSLMEGVMFQLHGRDGSGAIWHSGSASNTVLHGWLFFDPWILIAGVTAIPLGLAIRRLRPMAVAALILVVVGCRPGGYLPAMYVLSMIPFLALTAATSGEVIWRLCLRPRRRAYWVPLVALFGALSGSVLVVVTPQWGAALHGAMTNQTNTARADAERWMQRSIDPHAVVLTDDVSWVTLVHRNITQRENTIWFYKIDTDPALKPEFPNGWRDVDYILSTDQLRLAVAGDATLVNSATALRESRVVASFGSKDSIVEVRQVLHPAAKSLTGNAIEQDRGTS
jgi:4-amino-4-deoxy-L-arabinose transferase-like glycosyltransferase